MLPTVMSKNLYEDEDIKEKKKLYVKDFDPEDI
jgi:hypothetical protein